MSVSEQTNFINNNLGPKLKKNGLNTKIIVYDHNYDNLTIPLQVTGQTSSFTAGAGFHHYGGTPTNILIYKTQYSNKDMWMTECGFGDWYGGGLGSDENIQWQAQMLELITTSRSWSKGRKIKLLSL